MVPSTIALIILALLLIVYITNVIPPVVATLVALVAMTLTNIITPSQAFAGFGGTAAIMIMGMNVVGAAFFTTGVSAALGRFLYTKGGSNERVFILICCLMGFFMGMFINPMAVISLFMPIIDSVESQSGGKIQRKFVYLPTAIASIYGGVMTAVSTSATVTANGLLNEATGQNFGFFQPAILLAPGAILMFILLPTVSYKLMKKTFTFEAPALPATAGSGSGASEQKVDKTKAAILFAVLVLAICGFAFTKLNMGLIALTAATILMLTGCISVKDAIGKISWSTIILLAAGTGFSAGLQASGAADMLANACIGIAGDNPFMLCAIVFVFCTILSNLMANTNAVLIVAPIAISLATALGVDVLPFVLAAAVGAGLSVATILSNASVTITASVGYRFKDFMAYGGLVNALAAVLGVISLKIFFF